MDNQQKARNIALTLLSAKMYTCKELFNKLTSKGIEKDLAELTVTELIQNGLLDDKRYAEFYIEDSVSLGAKGLYRIKQELYRKGISSSVVQSVLDEKQELDTKSALKEYISLRGLCNNISTRKDLEKLKARLVRRGFSLTEINQCLAEYTFDFEDDIWQNI